MSDLTTYTDDELRAEAHRRGYELHSKAFSDAAQQLLREIPDLRARLDTLEALAKSSHSSR